MGRINALLAKLDRENADHSFPLRVQKIADLQARYDHLAGVPATPAEANHVVARDILDAFSANLADATVPASV